MRTTVSGTLIHLCPHVDEVDVGTVEIVFAGPAPELHEVAAFLDGYRQTKITHEALTRQIHDRYECVSVVTHWRTAGLDVECRVP